MAQKQATVGVKNLYYAIATVAEDGTVTYGPPKLISNVEKIDISVSASAEKYYADDRCVDIINSFEGATTAIETYGIDNSTLRELMGNEVDANGVTISKAIDDSKDIALGFQSRKRNGKYRFVWLVLGKKQHNNEEYETIKGKQTPKNEKLTFDFVSREDGVWKYTVDEDDENAPADLGTKWFTKVYDGSFAV